MDVSEARLLYLDFFFPNREHVSFYNNCQLCKLQLSISEYSNIMESVFLPIYLMQLFVCCWHKDLYAEEKKGSLTVNHLLIQSVGCLW